MSVAALGPGWGFALDPTGGAYSATPDPVAVFRGPTSKWRLGSRVVSVLDSGAEDPGSNRSRDAVG